jgi:predicted PurR-regulated permease PerM
MSWRVPWLARTAPVAPDPDEPVGEDSGRDTEPDAVTREHARVGPDDDAIAREHAPVDPDDDAITRERGPADPTVPPWIVPRWVQLVVLPLALLGLWALARASGSVLLILVIASIVALMLNPLVEGIQRVRVPRGLAILLVYMSGLAILAGIGILLANPISTQVHKFAEDLPRLARQANHDLDQVQRFFNRNGIHIHIEKQGQTALQTLQTNLGHYSKNIASFAQDLLGKVITVSFDIVLTLVLSVYLLVYGRQIGELVRKIMPPGDGTPEDDFPLLVQKAVSGYVRGQISFSVIMGSSAALALWIFGLLGIFPQGGDYAIVFGIFYGLMEFIPYIGPIIGPIPAVVVALFHSPITAVWVVLLFIALQQLEGHFVAPQVFRISLRINPIIIILSLLVGFKLYGIVGALVALPVASVIRQVVVYLRRHLVLEPWGGHPSLAGVLPLGPDRCPDCGAAASGDDAFCRSCGASLEPRVRTPG